jgi:glycine cleavage system H lipoate-binding protein
MGKTTAVLRNHGCAGNVVDIYVLARDGSNGLQEANDDLKMDLAQMLESKKMITDFICIKDGRVIEVDVSLEVSISRINKKFEQEIRALILSKIDDFFNINIWEYGQELKDKDLIKGLAAVKQAEAFEVAFTTDDAENSGPSVRARFFEIIRPATVEVAFMYE